MLTSAKRHLIWGGAALVGATAFAQEEQKPNVLVILLDDAGYNDFGFKGCKDLQTPNIDALAADGIVFSDGHTSASVSGPSRAGLLSGRYQQRGGYECNLEDTLGLNLIETTVADVFLDNGYSTACIGKWHQGDTEDYHPNNRGFEHFYGFIAGSRSYFFKPKNDDKAGSTRMLQHNGKQVKFDGYMTDVLSDAACEYIDEQTSKDKPFFMYLAYNAVHTPMEATKEDLARFEGHPRQMLAAMTWSVDKGIGQVIDKLKKNGQYDNTLIFFLSDNGGAHNNQSSNFPLKGFKGNKYEGGHRIPFFAVNAGNFKGQYDGLISSLDIMPTAMAYCGLKSERKALPLDGVNLLPYLNGKKKGDPHEMLFWRKQDMAAVRSGDYKLIRVQGVGSRLYNLKDNLDEDVDLLEKEPSIAKKLNKKLEKWEKGLVNPMLWDEGVWNDVTRNIHQELMNNKKVTIFSPDQLKKKRLTN